MNHKLDNLIVKHSKAKQYAEVDGNYTLVELREGKVRAFGISKRNCNCDDFDAERGFEIAFFRALKKLDAAVKVAPKKPKKK